MRGRMDVDAKTEHPGRAREGLGTRLQAERKPETVAEPERVPETCEDTEIKKRAAKLPRIESSPN